jgi:YD repeat-containing protein
MTGASSVPTDDTVISSSVQYDKDGNVTQTTAALAERTSQFEYDALGRMTKKPILTAR